MLRLSSYLILACLPLHLVAETVPDPLIGLEADILDDMPIVLSATRLTQPLNESPVAMTIIDREMIDASGARTIPDLLRLVPGFQVGYFDGNSPVATYHGHSDEYSRRVQVLIDGRSIYVPALAAIQWSDLITTIDEIERIEVIRGPNAAAYGNNSFLGVISIITRDAIEDQGQKIQVTTGSHNTTDAMYRFGGQTESIDYRITLGTHNNDGTDLLNDYTHADYFSYRIDHQINTKTQLFYQGGYKDSNYGDHEPPPDHENQATSAFQWLRWEHISSSNNSLSLQYYYNYNDQDMTNENLMIFLFDPIDPFPDAPITILSERHDLEFNYIHNLDKLRLVSGLSARLDIVNAENVFISNDTQRHKLYRAFSHGEYRFNNSWLLNAGLMIENNDISGTDYAPRLTVIHHLNKTNTLRIGASRATRTPTLFDQNAYVRINQQLTQDGGDPLTTPYTDILGGTDVLNLVDLLSPFDIESEEIESFEIGLISQLINKKLILDAKLFKDKTDKLISDTSSSNPQPAVADNYDGEAKYIINSHKTEMQGLEIALDYKHSKDFRIYGYYAYIDIQADLINPIGNTGDIRRLEVSAPTNSYGVMMIKHWPDNLSTSLIFFRVGEMDWTDRTGSGSPYFIDKSSQAYNKLDFNINKSYRYGKNRLNLALSIQNLIEDYYDYNKTRYTDASMTTIAPDTGISAYGSLQDMRTYLEISYLFN